jgi:cytochrome c biogenesis protein CcmG, thiol:disulfide interchange protein DsbE
VLNLKTICRSLVVAMLVTALGCDRGSHPAQIGRPAPDFVVQDGAHRVQLSQYRGKVVILNFWASWCAPCIEELPSLIDLQHKMPQVIVLTVSIDEDETAYREFLAEHHVDLLSIRDPGQHSNHLYGTEKIPESYVIDRTGTIRRKFISAQEWTSPDIVTYLNRLSA